MIVGLIVCGVNDNVQNDICNNGNICLIGYYINENDVDRQGEGMVDNDGFVIELMEDQNGGN